MWLYDFITVIWISWVGSAGIIITLLASSERYKDHSMKKIWIYSSLLATVVVICLLLTLTSIQELF